MKHLALSLLLAVGHFFTTSSSIDNPEVLGQAQASFDTEVFDFGEISKGGEGTHHFVLTNSGSEPLIISRCEKTCGCTLPTCSPDPIVTGKSSKVVVTYDTQRVGPFNKTVKVHTNDPDRPIIHLRIKGTVAA